MEQPTIPPSSSKRQNFLFLALGAGLVLSTLTGTAGYYLGKNKAGKASTVACTGEAKICPDGSTVARVPPACEFAPCPAQIKSSPSSSPVNALPSPDDQTVDFAKCETGTGYNLTVGFGSTSLEILADKGDSCEVRIKNEAEGSYTMYQCAVPQTAGEVSFKISGTGSDFSPIEKYCSTKTKSNINIESP